MKSLHLDSSNKCKEQNSQHANLVSTDAKANRLRVSVIPFLLHMQEKVVVHSSANSYVHRIMKPRKKFLEYIPPSGSGVSAVVALIALNCLLLVFQLASNASKYEFISWWPGSHQQTTCANMTSTMEEKLNMSTIDLSYGEVRNFRAHGVATRLIVEVGSYRNGPRTFSSVVMTSKRLNNLHKILYECEWVTADRKALKVRARAIKPDWNMGELYGTMVIVCSFPEDVGTDSEGGRLVLTAGYADAYRAPERFVALTEMRGEYSASRFHPPYPYDVTFCGSPLYGNISPQRIREWIAYHAHFFGNRTLFVFQDAGGIHDEVYRVLKPWIDLGRVRVENLRQAEVYEGYYHHQFTMLNDCLMRSQTLANWTFFFDVDEFLYIPEKAENRSILELLTEKTRNNVTQILFQNIKMSDALCQKNNRTVNDSVFMADISRKWAFEKLVYAKCDYGWVTEESRKYAVKPQLVWATGVHYSEHIKQGESVEMDADSVLRSYHYHDTVNERREICKEFPEKPNGEPNSVKVKNCTLDFSMAALGPAVRQYELATVGEQPFMS